MVLEVAGKMFSVRKLVVWSVYICVQYRQWGDICVEYRQWGGGGALDLWQKLPPIGEVQRFSAPNWRLFQKSLKVLSEKKPKCSIYVK